MTEESILVNSPLSQKISSGGRTVTVEIYKLEHEKSWVLEIVDQFNNSTVWDDTFSSESAALTEAKEAILENRVSNFIGPENGKSNDEWR
jgi:16S rRNA U1498 N3-methylase RsmE